MGKLALHWQIIIGMVIGGIFGYIMTQVGGEQFTADWIKPIGKIFINLLKLIAIPLIIASLIKGISDLKDISKFKTIGLRTILLYIMSTVIAITIGLIVVNTINPGSSISPELMAEISGTYGEKASAKISSAGSAADRGPLQFLVDMVPETPLLVVLPLLPVTAITFSSSSFLALVYYSSSQRNLNLSKHSLMDSMK